MEGRGNSWGRLRSSSYCLGDYPISTTHPVCIRGVIHADITAPHKRRGRRRGGASWCATSSCPSYPAPPFPPPSQSVNPNPSSAFNNSYKWWGSPHSLLSTPKQCLSAQRRNKKKMREQHDCFWHANERRRRRPSFLAVPGWSVDGSKGFGRG